MVPLSPESDSKGDVVTFAVPNPVVWSDVLGDRLIPCVFGPVNDAPGTQPFDLDHVPFCGFQKKPAEDFETKGPLIKAGVAALHRLFDERGVNCSVATLFR